MAILPPVLLDLVYHYVDLLNACSDLPKLKSVRKLVHKSDQRVLGLLGSVMRLPGSGDGVRFRLVMEDFEFYFRLSAGTRLFLREQLRWMGVREPHTARVIWLMLMKGLVHNPRFGRLFTNSLYVRLSAFLNAPNS